jgi:3',5'-cyclic AMP phosphodiesterase CpdA
MSEIISDNGLTWLHLSDIHFGHGSAEYGIDQELVVEWLANDAVSQVESGVVDPPDLIVVSGDIANSGARKDREEYTKANIWLTDLANRLHVPRHRVLLVPGNHDVERHHDLSNRHLMRLLQSVRNHGEPLDSALEHPSERRLLGSRFKAFGEFSNLWTDSPSSSDVFAWSESYVLANGFSVRFAGINSSLLAADDDDEGKLQIGMDQIRTAIGAKNEAGEMLVILTHHPLDWLRRASAAAAESWFDTSVHVHLSGHLHKPSGEHTHTPAAEERSFDYAPVASTATRTEIRLTDMASAA